MLLTRGLVGLASLFFPASYIYPRIPVFISRFHHRQLEAKNRKFKCLTMNGYLCQANTHSPCSSLASFRTHHNHPLVPCQSFKPCKVNVSHCWPNQDWSSVQSRKDKGLLLAVECASWGLEAELEKELEDEMKRQEGEEEKERVGMARFRHKCGERKGVVELLECLEREAIMGEDVGKEPVDYNRRAQIFDRSSTVFQALRELNGDALKNQRDLDMH